MNPADQERERRFDALFESYLADMVAYCVWRAKSAADAEDAVSEVFLAAWRRLDEVPSGHEARLWLYGTARRVMANQARTGRRKALLHVRLQAFPPPEAAGHSHMDSEASSQLIEAVREALAALRPADRETLLLSGGRDSLRRRSRRSCSVRLSPPGAGCFESAGALASLSRSGA